jgi:DNA-binding protein
MAATETTAAVEVPAPETEDTKNDEAAAPKEPEREPESIYDPDLPNRIIVGRGRPLSFYVDRARRVFRIEEEVHVTGRGDNISTACKLVEALKRQKIAVITKMSTGMDVQPYFNAAGDAKWGQPTAVILFKLKRGELGQFIADYQQRKVIEIFEANDPKCTGELSVETAEALDLGTKFKAKEEQMAQSKAFLGKVSGPMDLPTFIKYASILIHPLLRNKVFKEVLTNEFNIEVSGVARSGAGSGEDKDMQLVD